MENISFDLYRLFYVVANSKTISNAAETLYITQPAVTQGIKKLEEQIGGKLFYRNNRGISLTEEGNRLYKYIEKSIQILDNTHRTFDKYINLEEGKIRIKSGNIEEKKSIYESISRFMNDYSNIEVNVSDGVSSQSIEDLSKGKNDLVILNLPYNNEIDEKIIITELENYNLEMYCTKQYFDEKIGKENLSLKDLNGLDFIFAPIISNTGSVISNFFKDNNISFNVRFSSPSATERCFMAEKSLGILVALKGSVDSTKLKKLKISEKLPKVRIGVATLNDEIMGFATKELLRYIKGEK